MALEYAAGYADQEVVGPLLLPVADAGDVVGSVLEVSLQDLWPEATYAKESVAIKELVKGLGVPSTAGEREPKGAGGGAGDESSGSDSTVSSSEPAGSPLESAGSAAAATKRGGGVSAPRSDSGKRDGGAFVVGGKSAAGRPSRGARTKRKRGPAGTSASKSAGGENSIKQAPKRWRLPVVGSTVRVHGPVPGGLKVV